MTTIDTAALRALAERAKQTWEVEPFSSDAWHDADSKLHTALGGLFVHDTILALLDEIEAAPDAIRLAYVNGYARGFSAGKFEPDLSIHDVYAGAGYHSDVYVAALPATLAEIARGVRA